MNTRPISEIANKNNNLNSAGENRHEKTDLLSAIENRIAESENGLNAFAAKSFRSARYTLIKRLAAKGSRVLSLQDKSDWVAEEKAFGRLGIEIIFPSSFSGNSLSETLSTENISVIYLSTIDTSTLKVHNFTEIITTAHRHGIPVVFDNTAGFLGTVFKPLSEKADFVIDNVESYDLFRNTRIGAFIIEGKNLAGSPVTPGTSFLDVLKLNRALVNKHRFLPLGPESPVDKLLIEERARYRQFGDTTYKVARWLNQSSLVSRVEYPGITGDSSSGNAESHFTGGFGNVLRFSPANDDFGFSLLRSFFISGRPAGLNIKTDTEKRSFRVEITQTDAGQVLEYFQRVIHQLEKELEFKKSFKKRLAVERALAEVLKNMKF
jgi:hypothetical protein